jgi:hypothetical protein
MQSQTARATRVRQVICTYVCRSVTDDDPGGGKPKRPLCSAAWVDFGQVPPHRQPFRSEPSQSTVVCAHESVGDGLEEGTQGGDSGTCRTCRCVCRPSSRSRRWVHGEQKKDAHANRKTPAVPPLPKGPTHYARTKDLEGHAATLQVRLVGTDGSSKPLRVPEGVEECVLAASYIGEGSKYHAAAHRVHRLPLMYQERTGRCEPPVGIKGMIRSSPNETDKAFCRPAEFDARESLDSCSAAVQLSPGPYGVPPDALQAL